MPSQILWTPTGDDCCSCEDCTGCPVCAGACSSPNMLVTVSGIVDSGCGGANTQCVDLNAPYTVTQQTPTVCNWSYAFPPLTKMCEGGADPQRTLQLLVVTFVFQSPDLLLVVSLNTATPYGCSHPCFGTSTQPSAVWSKAVGLSPACRNFDEILTPLCADACWDCDFTASTARVQSL